MPLSMIHLVILLLVVALVFGTSKLKGIGKDLGGAIKDFKDTMNPDDKKGPPGAGSSDKKSDE